MELIQIERIRLDKEERNILGNAFYIINQLHEKTTDYDLSVLTGELLNGLINLKEYYEKKAI